jgi:hypothetical protein
MQIGRSIVSYPIRQSIAAELSQVNGNLLSPSNLDLFQNIIISKTERSTSGVISTVLIDLIESKQTIVADQEHDFAGFASRSTVSKSIRPTLILNNSFNFKYIVNTVYFSFIGLMF